LTSCGPRSSRTRSRAGRHRSLIFRRLEPGGLHRQPANPIQAWHVEVVSLTWLGRIFSTENIRAGVNSLFVFAQILVQSKSFHEHNTKSKEARECIRGWRHQMFFMKLCSLHHVIFWLICSCIFSGLLLTREAHERWEHRISSPPD
jgi:hypothetical protein